MALPSIIDAAQSYLFADEKIMAKNNVPAATQQHLIRLRDMYNFWLAFPKKRDGEIVLELCKRYGLQKTAAYDDIKVIKFLLGDLQKTSKDYHRYRFLEMIQQAYKTAQDRGDARSMVAAADKYAKYTQLDKEDLIDKGYDKIVVQPFEPTDDPSVLGLKPIPNVREFIQKKIKQYWAEDVEDIEAEEVEFNEDKIFHPKENEQNIP